MSGSLPPDAKFFIGERVAFSSSWKHWHWGHIHSYYGYSEGIHFWNIKSLDGELFKIGENFIIKVPGISYLNLSMIECTCGLKYVRDGGLHSAWCALANTDPFKSS